MPSVWKLDVACCRFVPRFYGQVWEEASGSLLLPTLGNSGSAGSRNPRGIHRGASRRPHQMLSSQEGWQGLGAVDPKPLGVPAPRGAPDRPSGGSEGVRVLPSRVDSCGPGDAGDCYLSVCKGREGNREKGPRNKLCLAEEPAPRPVPLSAGRRAEARATRRDSLPSTGQCRPPWALPGHGCVTPQVSTQVSQGRDRPGLEREELPDWRGEGSCVQPDDRAVCGGGPGGAHGSRGARA